MLKHTNSCYRGCRQDVIRDCPETLHVSNERPCLVATIRRLAAAGEQAAFSVADLIRLLNSGMPVSTVVDLIELRFRAQSHLGSRTYSPVG
jgi:hypothetical protein